MCKLRMLEGVRNVSKEIKVINGPAAQHSTVTGLYPSAHRTDANDMRRKPAGPLGRNYITQVVRGNYRTHRREHHLVPGRVDLAGVPTHHGLSECCLSCCVAPKRRDDMNIKVSVALQHACAHLNPCAIHTPFPRPLNARLRRAIMAASWPVHPIRRILKDGAAHKH
jgi:hypothetical protein